MEISRCQCTSSLARSAAHACSAAAKLALAAAIATCPSSGEGKIAAIAKALNTSHSTLSRVVKAKYGMTPNHYITQRKLEKALLLLKSNKNVSIKEISFLLGFNSVSYFSKCFKKKYGHFPSYRR